MTAIRYSKKVDGKEAILVAVPQGPGGRKNGIITMFLVNDDKTLTVKNIYSVSDSSRTYMYSCMSELPDGTVGLLWENLDGYIRYDNFDIGLLMGGGELEGQNINVSLSNGETYTRSYTVSADKKTGITTQPDQKVAKAELQTTGGEVKTDIPLTAPTEGQTLTKAAVSNLSDKVTVKTIWKSGNKVLADNAKMEAGKAYTAIITLTATGADEVFKADALTTAQSNLTLKNGTVVTDATGVFTYKVTGADTVEVTGITEKGKKKAAVKISSTMKGNGKTYKITSVAANALKGNKKMTSLMIGNNVVTIGKNAFANCTKLKKVTVNGSSLKTIGKNAFGGDKKLKTINMKKVKSLKTVAKGAFKAVNKKVTVKVPKAKKAAYKRLFKKGGIAASRIKC